MDEAITLSAAEPGCPSARLAHRGSVRSEASNFIQIEAARAFILPTASTRCLYRIARPVTWLKFPPSDSSARDSAPREIGAD